MARGVISSRSYDATISLVSNERIRAAGEARHGLRPLRCSQPRPHHRLVTPYPDWSRACCRPGWHTPLWSRRGQEGEKEQEGGLPARAPPGVLRLWPRRDWLPARWHPLLVWGDLPEWRMHRPDLHPNWPLPHWLPLPEAAERCRTGLCRASSANGPHRGDVPGIVSSRDDLRDDRHRVCVLPQPLLCPLAAAGRSPPVPPRLSTRPGWESRLDGLWHH
jgi:hypothetical protein